MNGETLESYDESYDEGVETIYDESYDESAEFLPGLLGGILPGIASGIGGLVSNIVRPQPPRAPLPGINLPSLGPGVTNAQLNTPAGSATIALPSAVVRLDEYRADKERTQTALNQLTGRVNAVAGDVGRLRSDFVRIETDTRNQLAKLRTDTRASIIRERKLRAAAMDKLKKDQSSQQTTNLMMTMMMQQQVQGQFNAHTHGASTDAPKNAGGTNSSMLFLLPFLMSGDSGSGDNMMLPMMMMVMANQNK
jgi:hypothetical protein